MTHKSIWTFAITSVALFMVTLDNLVVSTALPVIRTDLSASLSQLEWTVNAYTLTFAVLLLMGAALGDRLGRRRVFSVGLGVFTLASAAAALAPSAEALNAARAVQGLGAAIVLPLTLTIRNSSLVSAGDNAVRPPFDWCEWRPHKLYSASVRTHFSICSSLSTENALETPRARMPARFLSIELSTTPSRTMWPPFTRMWIG